MIFDRSRATFLLILISVKKLSSFDRSSIFSFFLNPLKFKYAYVRFKILIIEVQKVRVKVLSLKEKEVYIYDDA